MYLEINWRAMEKHQLPHDKNFKAIFYYLGLTDEGRFLCARNKSCSEIHSETNSLQLRCDTEPESCGSYREDGNSSRLSEGLIIFNFFLKDVTFEN